jgi:hypothetical protein
LGYLAGLYGVPIRQLNQQIKRNRERFPSDFVFQLTAKEHEILRSQIVISRDTHGGRRYLPFAFTEHGAIMAATVLNSKRAPKRASGVRIGFQLPPENGKGQNPAQKFRGQN